MKLIPSHLNAYRNKVQSYLKKCNKPQHLSILKSHQLASNQNSASAEKVEDQWVQSREERELVSLGGRERQTWFTGTFMTKEGNRTKETGKARVNI